MQESKESLIDRIILEEAPSAFELQPGAGGLGPGPDISGGPYMREEFRRWGLQGFWHPNGETMKQCRSNPSMPGCEVLLELGDACAGLAGEQQTAGDLRSCFMAWRRFGCDSASKGWPMCLGIADPDKPKKRRRGGHRCVTNSGLNAAGLGTGGGVSLRDVTRDIQEILLDLGYFSPETNRLVPDGTNADDILDGRCGPQTKEAIRLFQGDEGLEDDGILGKSSLPALMAKAGEGAGKVLSRKDMAGDGSGAGMIATKQDSEGREAAGLDSGNRMGQQVLKRMVMDIRRKIKGMSKDEIESMQGGNIDVFIRDLRSKIPQRSLSQAALKVMDQQNFSSVPAARAQILTKAYDMAWDMLKPSLDQYRRQLIDGEFQKFNVNIPPAAFQKMFQAP